MKATRFFAALICGLAMCLSFSSCSSDDDGDGGNASLSIAGGNASLSIAGSSASFSFVGWNIHGRGDEVWYVICFANYDVPALSKSQDFSLLPNVVSNVFFAFKAPRGTELPTGEFKSGDTGGFVGVNKNDPDSGTYFGIEDESVIKITKDGDNYTFVVDPLVYIPYENIDEEKGEKQTTTFTYTGPIPFIEKLDMSEY